MLSTDSLPRKWSIRKICDSSNTACSSGRESWPSQVGAERLLDDDPGAASQARSRRASRPPPSNAAGGTARWNSRRGEPPISFSASRDRLAQRGGVVRVGAAEGQVLGERRPGRPFGLVCRTPPPPAARARGTPRRSSPIGRGRPDDPVRSGISPAAARWNSPGSSLRLARSPVAPNRTMTWLSGRGPDRMGRLELTGLPGLGCGLPGLGCGRGLRAGLALRGHRFSPPSSPCAHRTRTAWRTAPCR